MAERLAPQDLASEEALLGALLTAPGKVRNVQVDSEDFYRERHGLIWQAALKTAHNGGCDVVTVAAELERRGQLEQVGGKDRLALLVSACPAPGNARAYGRRIKEKAEQRRVRATALRILEAVDKDDEKAVTVALADLGIQTRYVDTGSGEIVDACPTCSDRDAQIQKMEHELRQKRAAISRLEGKVEKKAREHRLWNEIEAVFDWYRMATGHFGVTFTVDEFNQALPRWKQYGRGKANPCKPALKAICGIAFDPSTTKGRNQKPRVFDKWELLNRNQFSWEDFHDRVPGETDTDWWRILINLIEANLGGKTLSSAASG